MSSEVFRSAVNVRVHLDLPMEEKSAKHAQQTHTVTEQQNAEKDLSIVQKLIMSLVIVCSALLSMDQTAMMASAMSVRMGSTAQMAEDVLL